MRNLIKLNLSSVTCANTDCTAGRSRISLSKNITIKQIKTPFACFYSFITFCQIYYTSVHSAYLLINVTMPEFPLYRYISCQQQPRSRTNKTYLTVMDNDRTNGNRNNRMRSSTPTIKVVVLENEWINTITISVPCCTLNLLLSTGNKSRNLKARAMLSVVCYPKVKRER